MQFKAYITLFAGFIINLTASLMAYAAPIDDIRALIASGDYEQARVLAAQINTSEGYALAAESLAAQIMLGEVGKLNKHSKEAHELAKTAVALDPTFYDAKLQYALTNGFVTRTSGDLTAWRKKLPMKTYQAIQEFRADYPQDARAIALEGAWHLGVVRKTGEKSGQKWFGASGDKGRELYKAAIEIAPQDIIIRTNYVMALLALKEDPDVSLVKANLEDIMLMAPTTDMETKVKAYATTLYTYLGDKKIRKKKAERFLDGK